MSLSDGVWLAISLVPWYIGGVGYLLSEGIGQPGMFAYAVVSVLSLGASVWLGVKNRQRRFGWVFLPLGLCFVFVFIAGLFRGQVRDPGLIHAVASAVEVAALAFMVWRLRPYWFTAGAFAVFSASLWLFALFVSSMSFTDTWL